MAEATRTHLNTVEDGQKKLTGRSGKTYYIEENISGLRFQEFEIAQRELATGLSIPALYQEIIEIYELTDKTKTVKKKNGDIETIVQTGTMARRLHDVAAGILKIGQRKSTIFKICSLFINGENEDRGIYNETVMNAKMDDLISVYPYRFFFQLATASLQELLTDLETLTRIGLAMPVTEEV